MWPWGHLAVGYLLYSAFARRYDDRPPSGLETVALAFGTQFPDLVDKPLAWSVSVLPNGRSLAHSILVAAVVIGLVALVCRRLRRKPVAVAFGIGYVSHLASDALPVFPDGPVSDLAFLLWPLLPPVEYDTQQSFAAHFLGIEPTPLFLFQIVLLAVALVVWIRDGMPGTTELRDLLTRRKQSA
jgi:membrane-bound metal-dependent hydrolase YbcI (DUF457 family)